MSTFRKSSLPPWQIKPFEVWTDMNPVLLKGEIIIVEFVGYSKLKIGDGTRRFNELPFIEEGINTIEKESTSRELEMEEIINIICAGA